MRIKKKEENLIRKKSELIKKKYYSQNIKKEKINNIKKKFEKKYSYVKPKFGIKTTSVIGKQREKFDFDKEIGKFGNNFAGVLVRTTGRKLVNWKNR